MRFIEKKKEKPMFGMLNQDAPPADGPPQDRAVTDLRTHITYILVVAWIIIVLGKAFGVVNPSFETDALLIGSLGVAFGYLYARTVPLK